MLIKLLKKHPNTSKKYTNNDDIFQSEKASHISDTFSREQILQEAGAIKESFLTDMSRGILSVLLLLAALCGGLQLTFDRQNGLYVPFTPLVKNPAWNCLKWQLLPF